MSVHSGLKLLGIKFWPSGRTLTKRNISRSKEKLTSSNVSSYSGIIKKHGNKKLINHFNWLVYRKLVTD